MPRTSVSDDYVRQRETLRSLALAPVGSADELVRNVSRLYHEVYERDLGHYASANYAAAAPQIMTEMFELRTILRDRIAEWHPAGFMTREAQHAIRDALRVLRYASDMMGEVHSGFAIGDTESPVIRAFREISYNTFVNPKFDTGHNLDFRSGDILLVRGMHNNSAAIARIGDVDSQFSHTAMIHFDDNGQGWLVESLIESGAVIEPLTHALEHRLARAILLRHRDADLAARASKLIYDHVRRSLDRGGKPILYDFSMSLGPSYNLFCSKLVRIAYIDASEGALKLPTFKTRFDARNKRFYRRIGVTADESFAPGDLEIEPELDIVAEWQDYRYTAQVRHQDLIMTKLFEWMELHGYRFEEDFGIRLVARLGRLATRLSKTTQNFVASLFARIPPNMPRRTIATIVMLHKTAQPLLEELQHIERLKIATEGRPLHPREVFDHLEDVRWKGRGRLGYLVAPRKWRRMIAKRS